MGVKKNIITINGRDYDTVTGQVIGHAKKVQVVSDVSRVVAPAVRSTSKPKIIPVRHVEARDPGQRAHSVHVKTEKSKTLKRNGLKKPTPILQAKHVQGIAKQPKHIVIQGRTGETSEKSQYSLKSNRISKFASHDKVHHKTASIAVKTAPQHSLKTEYNIDDTPPSLAVAAARELKEKVNIFEDALNSATSHHSQFKSKNRRAAKLRSSGALIAAVLLLTGFFAFQNAPNIALKAASNEIGFNANLPKYQPAGFGRSGAVQYQKGLVLVTYRSNSDDRSYTVSQTTANFDNFKLASNLAAQGKSFETANVNGQKIYISRLGATWVKHGVWYTVDGDAKLNTEQLTRIAASL